MENKYPYHRPSVLMYERPFEEIVTSLALAKIELEEVAYAVSELKKTVRRRAHQETVNAFKRLAKLGITNVKIGEILDVHSTVVTNFKSGRRNLPEDKYIKLLELSRGPKDH